MRAVRKKMNDVKARSSGWVHVFVCVERKRCQRRLGYTHSSIPILGIVARSENSFSMVAAVEEGLKLVAEKYKYKKIIVEGIKSDNGSAARATCEFLAPGKWKAGCFAHEIFKALLRNSAWTKLFSELETFWKSSRCKRETSVRTHQEEFGKEYNSWMQFVYRCLTERHFRYFGELLARFAEESC